MPHQNVNLHSLLLQLANTVRELCQRGIDKHRPLKHFNLDAVVADLLREHCLEQDFEHQLGACVNAMSQDDAIGQILVFERMSGTLHMRDVDALELMDTDIERFEMVVFDGGNTSGGSWKHVFFPRQRGHCFVSEA